jgi:hypothetical protein
MNATGFFLPSLKCASAKNPPLARMSEFSWRYRTA